jgi:hypothetical protein
VSDTEAQFAPAAKGRLHNRCTSLPIVKRESTVAILVLLSLAGCLHQNKETIPGAPNTAEKTPVFPSPPALSVVTNLAGPESVLHDPRQDVYFISNINGGLLTADDNGFITRVNAETMVVELKWIESGKNGVRLDAPKGMAIVGDSLYVSDITAVRKFDRRTGAPQADISLAGATLINDLTTDGVSVYVSDTGVKPAAGITFQRTGTDAIWKITADRATKIASGTHLNEPNGIEFTNGSLWVVSFRGNELYRLNGAEKSDVRKLPHGQLDGLVHLADGTPVVSSWIGDAIYRGAPDGFAPYLKAIDAPADIGYDRKRHRLLVPRSTTNEVTIHPLR